MKIIFVTGKGGVGKTSFASALALKKANSSKKVLLVEFGPKSYFKYIFSKNTQDKKIHTPKGLEVVTWQYEQVLVEFITYYLKFKPLVEKFFASPIMKKLIKVAPSLRELVYLGKATSPFRNIGKDMNYDYIIIDSYATGHFLALLRSPTGMMAAVSKGVMHEQCKTIMNVMKDRDKVSYYIVTLPEKLPLIETVEFVNSLKEEFDIEPKVIFNKVKENLQTAGSSAFEIKYLEQVNIQNENINKTKLEIEQSFPYIYEIETSKLVQSMSKRIIL